MGTLDDLQKLGSAFIALGENVVTANITGSAGSAKLIKDYGTYVNSVTGKATELQQSLQGQGKKPPQTLEVVDFDTWLKTDPNAQLATEADKKAAQEFIENKEEAEPAKDIMGKAIEGGRSILTVTQQGITTGAKAAGSWFGENGVGITGGLLAMIAAFAMGLNPLMMLLMAVVGFAIGSLMDKNGAVNQLINKFTGPGKDDPEADGPALSQNVNAPAPVVAKEEALIKVVQKDAEGHSLAINGVDADGKPTYGAHKEVTLALRDSNNKTSTRLTGEVSADFTSFHVTGYQYRLPDGSWSEKITTDKSIGLTEGAFNPAKSDVLNPLREEARLKIEEFKKPELLKVDKAGEAGQVEVKLGQHTANGATYDVVMQGTVANEKANFTHAVLKDKDGQLVTDAKGQNLTFDIASRLPKDGLAVNKEDQITLMHGELAKFPKAFGEQIIAAKQLSENVELNAIVGGIEKGNVNGISGAWNKKLSENGVANTGTAMGLAMKIGEKYNSEEFRNLSARDAAIEIAAMIKSDPAIDQKSLNMKQLEAFAERTHKGVGEAVSGVKAEPVKETGAGISAAASQIAQAQSGDPREDRRDAGIPGTAATALGATMLGNTPGTTSPTAAQHPAAPGTAAAKPEAPNKLALTTGDNQSIGYTSFSFLLDENNRVVAHEANARVAVNAVTEAGNRARIAGYAAVSTSGDFPRDKNGDIAFKSLPSAGSAILSVADNSIDFRDPANAAVINKISNAAIQNQTGIDNAEQMKRNAERAEQEAARLGHLAVKPEIKQLGGGAGSITFSYHGYSPEAGEYRAVYSGTTQKSNRNPNFGVSSDLTITAGNLIDENGKAISGNIVKTPFVVPDLGYARDGGVNLAQEYPKYSSAQGHMPLAVHVNEAVAKGNVAFPTQRTNTREEGGPATTPAGDAALIARGNSTGPTVP